MIRINFPDNSSREYKNGVTGLEIAESISKSLAKKAFIVEIDEKLCDLSLPINQDSRIKILTAEDEQALETIRHDAAHIMAQAVKQLFPKVQVTIGPAIENGFYYDFTTEQHLSEKDLELIEAQMKKIVSNNYEIQRQELVREEAIEFFKSIGEKYKAEIISSIPEGEKITLYKQGDFIDLCRGPHGPSTGYIKHFKLMKLAGAYWRGDSKNAMLQRVYGTAWGTKQQLDDYLHMLAEAEKRDHRKIGKDLDLFHLQEEAKGMVFWHPKGWTLFQILENYIRDKIRKNGYVEVKTPVLVDKKLWEKSGHWEKFREDMFAFDMEDETLAIKPMNCPCHVEIFKQKIRSYRDLPLRMAEFGHCHRNESSGGLHGLLRVRGFNQDDAHIFCTEDQITDETIKFCKLLQEIYKDLGFEEIIVKFSDRPDMRAGSDEVWDKAEESLKTAAIEAGLNFTVQKGEGAFYGPKLEFVLKDAINRQWQCGTLQVDFVLPERLDANYISPEGTKKRPVMLHRAILGTFERFIGILLEHYAGALPVWLSPLQVVIITVTNQFDDYAKKVYKNLIDENIRCDLDISSDKINYKIRNLSLQKVPVIGIIGEEEVKQQNITLRFLGSDEQKKWKVEELVKFIKNK